MHSNDTLLAAIDANINRAMEGLRVCEDVCRFVLHDESLSYIAKQYRHSVEEHSQQWQKIALLSSRDVVSDPIKFVTKQSSDDAYSIENLFIRNIHRAIEAVRSLEECARTTNKDYACFQALRFSMYAFEKEVLAKLLKTKYIEYFTNTLYAILDPKFVGDDLISKAGALIEGGSKIIQLRMKDISTKEIISVARHIRPLCEKHNVLFIINDRPDIAHCVDADGVHLGQDDMDVVDARKVMGIGKIIGLSTHSVDEVKSALAKKPDYIAIGPVFSTSSKYGTYMEGLSADSIQQMVSIAQMPVVAIGGINAKNVSTVKELGIRCIAVLSALYDGDIVQNCRLLSELISK